MRKKSKLQFGLILIIVFLYIMISTGCLSSIFPENLGKTNDNPSAPTSVSEQPAVGIVYTLTSQNYQPNQPFAENELGEITKAGISLENKLISQNIKTVNDLTIHDQPVFSQAYSKSQITVDKLLETNPQLKLVLDLHRDAVPENKPADYTTVKLPNGDSAAKILFVVNQTEQEKTSLNAAQFISDYLNNSVPNLSRGVITRNENVINSAKSIPIITLYIGDYKRNTLSDAEKTTELLADAIFNYLKAEK